MSLTFKLWDSSSGSVDLLPEWNYKDGKTKIYDRSRSKTGGLFQYSHGHYQEFVLNVKFAPSSVAGTVNSWWENQQLCQFDVNSNGTSAITSVMITNKKSPFQSFSKLQIDRYDGKIELSTY